MMIHETPFFIGGSHDSLNSSNFMIDHSLCSEEELFSCRKKGRGVLLIFHGINLVLILIKQGGKERWMSCLDMQNYLISS